MLKSTESKLLHLIGALLYHNCKLTGIPVAMLLDEVVIPTLEEESFASQVEIVQLILRGEAAAREIDASLNACRNTMNHARDESEQEALEPRLSRTKDWRLN